MDDNSHLMAIRAAILPASPFWDDLQRKPIDTLAEIMKRAQRVVNLEEARLLLYNLDASTSAAKNLNTNSGQQQRGKDGFKRKNDNSQGEGNKNKKGDKYVPLYPVHTELNESRKRIYMTHEKIVPLWRIKPMKGNRAKHDMKKYCRYHRDHALITKEC